jgi:hypothetical protein
MTLPIESSFEINQSIETAQKLVEFYQSQLELTPQFKLLEAAKKNLAELRDKEREDYWKGKTISIVVRD